MDRWQHRRKFGGNNDGHGVTLTDALGCTDETSITVQENAFIPPIITGDPLLCPGADLTHTSEGPNYTNYTWSNNQQTPDISVNTPGTYTVTVTAASSCTGTASITVVVGTPANTTIVGNTFICNGNNTTLSAVGSFENYSWSNGLEDQSIIVNQIGVYSNCDQHRRLYRDGYCDRGRFTSLGRHCTCVPFPLRK